MSCRSGQRPVSEQRRAISIRQPMAWAVIHAGKDCENRLSSARRQFRPAVGARVLTLTGGVTGAAASCNSTTLGWRAGSIISLNVRRRNFQWGLCPDGRN